jgi:hypothetical protein
MVYLTGPTGWDKGFRQLKMVVALQAYIKAL